METERFSFNPMKTKIIQRVKTNKVECYKDLIEALIEDAAKDKYKLYKDVKVVINSKEFFDKYLGGNGIVEIDDSKITFHVSAEFDYDGIPNTIEAQDYLVDFNMFRIRDKYNETTEVFYKNIY